MPECDVPTEEVTVDGVLDEPTWQTGLPFFVGAESSSRVYVGMSHDATHLYIGVQMYTASESDEYTVRLSFDPQGFSTVDPVPGIYRIAATTHGDLTVEEGTGTGWHPIAFEGLSIKS